MRKKLYFALFCAVLCIIWGNSLLPPEISGEMSRFVASLLGGTDSGGEANLFVRKAAHFLEFAALGASFALLSRTYEWDRHKRALSQAFVGIFVPLCDESIQMFTRRGPSLSDVWIDIAGYTTGAVITLAVCFLIEKNKTEKSR